MTVLDDRQLDQCDLDFDRACREAQLVSRQPALRPVRGPAPRPMPARPAVAALEYRGTGVAVSRAPHARHRPVSNVVAVALAGVAALITLWLGSLAQFSGDRAVSANLPERLAVVHVQAGESLQQLARRIAPDAPAAVVVDRILDLNKLQSVSVDAGQSLIAPLG